MIMGNAGQRFIHRRHGGQQLYSKSLEFADPSSAWHLTARFLFRELKFAILRDSVVVAKYESVGGSRIPKWLIRPEAVAIRGFFRQRNAVFRLPALVGVESI
jgi:hypothetical protein